MRLFKRREPVPVEWEIKVTTPDGTVLQLDTGQLEAIWRFGERSNDGYLDILGMPRLHIWVRPRGWQEPDRSAALVDTETMVRPRR